MVQFSRRWSALGAAVLLWASAHSEGTSTGDRGTGKVQFGLEIQPILSEHCFACHGPDAHARKANLRLDQPGSFLADRSEGALIHPGHPETSPLFLRIVSPDDDRRMPPPDAFHQLDSDEIERLRAWIEQGAHYSPHWSFTGLNTPTVPELTDLGRHAPTHPIDRFIGEPLRRAGVIPSIQATDRVLVRRLAHDLTGLPADPASLEAVERGALSLDGYVEQLLTSPHYGERMAQHWLDLVRYADTVGYHGDQEWQMWPYRDHVIKAFNGNQPFDTFTIEQIAGDLLPEPSMAQRVAAGYNRLNMITFEGGSQAKEFLLKYAADRVRNVSTVWLGATMGCAQCHDHKFDPYTMGDFYRLSAFFADIDEVGVFQDYQNQVVPPEMKVVYPEQERRREELAQELKQAKRRFLGPHPELDARQEDWEAALLSQARSGILQAAIWVDDQQSNGGTTRDNWTFVEGKDGTPVHSGSYSRRQRGEAIVQHFFQGADRTLTIGEGDRLYAWLYLDPQAPPEQVMLQFHLNGSWEHRAVWGADRISFGGIGTDGDHRRHMGELPKAGEWVRLEVPHERVGLAAGDTIDGMAFTQFGGLAYWDAAGVLCSFPDLVHSPYTTQVALRTSRADRSQDQSDALRTRFRREHGGQASNYEGLQKAQAALDSLQDSLPRMLATVSVQPRDVRVLPRGNWMDESGDLVQPNVPAFLRTSAVSIPSTGATRLDLARWLVSESNPLAARAFVNRMWQLLFGRGLAATPGDLGHQGARPSHPELLDWLATQFVNSGWDVKQLVRTIVSSDTYRRSSAYRADLAALDPQGDLLASQRRWRKDAEFLRDGALAASGLLVPSVGGPSVKPYQPSGHWRELNFPKRVWQQGAGEDLYRRSLYTFWSRTFLHPALDAFDAPSREEACAERNRSNTPQQALVLMNDPSFVEAARVLATVALQASTTPESTVQTLWRRILARSARPAELRTALALFDTERQRFYTNRQSAHLLVSQGSMPIPEEVADSEDSNIELAAWTQVARLALNLHETVTRQ